MTANNETELDDIYRRPLKLHIRRLRQWYGKRPLTQQQLADLADVSLRQLQRYESCRELPQAISTLVRVAIALQVPFEALFAPSSVEETTADIEARRIHLGLDYQPEESGCRYRPHAS